MNKITFPDQDALLDVNVLRRLQQTYESLQSLSKLGGTGNYILTGCEVVGTNVSNGIVVINGEVLPFVSGALIETIIVVEEQLQVSSGGASLTEVNRHVTFGVGSGEILFSSIRHNRFGAVPYSKEFVISGWNMDIEGSKDIILADELPGLTSDNIKSVVITHKGAQTGNSDSRQMYPLDKFWWGSATGGVLPGVHIDRLGVGSLYTNMTVYVTIYFK